jgi:hypothetical protein
MGKIEINHATPMLLVSVLAFFIVVITKILGDEMKEWGFSMSDQRIDVDEDLPMFFSAIKLSQADEMVAEQARMKTQLGFMSIDPDTTELLDCTKIPNKMIQGTPWYTVTSNVDYATKFNYIQAGVEEREKLIEDGYDKNFVDDELDDDRKDLLFEQSDMVMVLLNLSYIPDAVV